MAVVSRIVVRNSDLTGAEGADTFEIDPAASIRDIAKEYAKISLDLTAGEGDDFNAAVGEVLDTFREDLANVLSDYYSAHAALKAAGSQTSGGAATKTTGGGADNAVRVWARQNGFTVGDRGRIKADVLAAYKAANSELVTDLDEPTADELAELESENV